MRVLIVDDEAPARDKLRRWLAEQPDVAVIGECSDGLEAVEMILSSSSFLHQDQPLSVAR